MTSNPWVAHEKAQKRAFERAQEQQRDVLGREHLIAAQQSAKAAQQSAKSAKLAALAALGAVAVAIGQLVVATIK
jgi:hypothetical protein